MTAPIGSVTAFAGSVSEQWEEDNGWLLCDGRALDTADPRYGPLFEAIGFGWGGDGKGVFHLPDLRGYFLRGVDGIDGGRDPDSGARRESTGGGNRGNAVGTVQDWATGLPHAPDAIEMSEDCRHFHRFPFETDATRDVDSQDNTVAYNPGQTFWSETAGNHTHELSGGGRETRPINAAVHWIIRFR